jgi:hypothetical protein
MYNQYRLINYLIIVIYYYNVGRITGHETEYTDITILINLERFDIF